MEKSKIPQRRFQVEGMQRLFKQFSFPSGIPSHAAPETPVSIPEGGELGMPSHMPIEPTFPMLHKTLFRGNASVVLAQQVAG